VEHGLIETAWKIKEIDRQKKQNHASYCTDFSLVSTKRFS